MKEVNLLEFLQGCNTPAIREETGVEEITKNLIKQIGELPAYKNSPGRIELLEMTVSVLMEEMKIRNN